MGADDEKSKTATYNSRIANHPLTLTVYFINQAEFKIGHVLNHTSKKFSCFKLSESHLVSRV